MKAILFSIFLLSNMGLLFSQDTNQVDEMGKRQGLWQFFEEDSLRMQAHFTDDEVKGIIQYVEHGGVVFELEDGSKKKRKWWLYSSKDTLVGYYIPDELKIIDTLGADVHEEAKYRIIALYEVYPSFPGGVEAMYRYLDTYPKKPKIHGKVRVQFTVGVHGEIMDASVKESTNEKLDAFAVKMIADMPAWQPASDAGKIVSVSLVLPLNF